MLCFFCIHIEAVAIADTFIIIVVLAVIIIVVVVIVVVVVVCEADLYILMLSVRALVSNACSN